MWNPQIMKIHRTLGSPHIPIGKHAEPLSWKYLLPGGGFEKREEVLSVLLHWPLNISWYPEYLLSHSTKLNWMMGFYHFEIRVPNAFTQWGQTAGLFCVLRVCDCIRLLISTFISPAVFLSLHTLPVSSCLMSIILEEILHYRSLLDWFLLCSPH